MDGRKEGPRDDAGGVRWGAVAVGWLAAVLAGIVIGPTLGFLYGIVEPPVEDGELPAAVVVMLMVSGFLSYLVGGYVAARRARRSGGKHGALTAVFGFVVGEILAIVLALLGAGLPQGAVVAPASTGFAGATLVAVLAVFLFGLFGGYVGGKLGEPL